MEMLLESFNNLLNCLNREVILKCTILFIKRFFWLFDGGIWFRTLEFC